MLGADPTTGDDAGEPTCVDTLPRASPPARPAPAKDGARRRDRPTERSGRLAALRRHLREPLFRNAYALMLSTVATGAVGLLFWALAARRYDAEVLGRNAALISAMVMVSSFAQLDFAAMLLRFLPRWRAEAGRAVWACYGVATLAAAIGATGFVLVAARLPGNLSFLGDGRLAVAFGVAVAAWGVFAIQDGVLTGLGRAPVVPVENTSFGVAKLALLAVMGAGWSWGIFVAWTVPVLVSLVPVNLLIFRRYLPAHRDRPAHPETFDRTTFTRFIAYDYAGALFGTMTTMAMPLLVIAMLGADASAHFYVAWTLVLIIDTVALSLGSSLVVEGSYDPERLAAHARHVLRRGAVLVVPTIAGVVVFAPLLLMLYGQDYSDSSTSTLRVLALGIVPRSLIIAYTAVGRVKGEVERVLVVVAAATVVIFGAVLVLGPRFGLVGVAGGWVLGYTVVAAAVAPGLWRAVHPPRHVTPAPA